MELWKTCDFDDRYYISSFGNIKRKLANGSEKILTGCILNKNKSHPYKYIQISRDGKRKNYLIHRLVAIAFCEGYSEINNICDHIDRNTFNNHYTNLRWGTQKDNMNNLAFNHTPETLKLYKKEQMKKRLIKITCPDCGRTFSKVNLASHKKSKIHINHSTKS